MNDKQEPCGGRCGEPSCNLDVEGKPLVMGIFEKMSSRKLKPSDQLPPHDPVAEEAVLGSVLLEPKWAMPQCVEMLKDGPEVFYDLRHQEIYRGMLALFDANEPIDPVTLHVKLQVAGKLEQVGGDDYIFRLQDAVGSAYNLPAYCQTVREKYVLRRALKVCVESATRIRENGSDTEELLDELERGVMGIRAASIIGKSDSVKELTRQAIDAIEEMHQRKGTVSGLATGFVDFDKMTGGLQPGDMIIIAAYPSTGKTSLAMNIVEYVALELKLPVAVFSLEMTGRSLLVRMLCSRARVNLRHIREGFLAERDFPKLTSAAGKLSGSNLHIEDISDLSIFQLRSKARRLFQQHGIRLFVIDYLQLLSAVGGARKVENRQQEVADISRGIKGLAKETNCPVIAMSQLNDDGALRESRAIGQDADIVSFLEYPDDKEDRTASDSVPVRWRIKKHRNGPIGTVNLTFLKAYTRFESASKVSQQDIPYRNQPDP